MTYCHTYTHTRRVETCLIERTWANVTTLKSMQISILEKRTKTEKRRQTEPIYCVASDFLVYVELQSSDAHARGIGGKTFLRT